jgi:hypothetical protein
LDGICLSGIQIGAADELDTGQRPEAFPVAGKAFPGNPVPGDSPESEDGIADFSPWHEFVSLSGLESLLSPGYDVKLPESIDYISFSVMT